MLSVKAYCISFSFRDHSCDVHVLQACHVYLSVIKEQSSQSILSYQSLAEVYACVENNLASHAHLVRLLTLKILTTFEETGVDANEVRTEIASYKYFIYNDHKSKPILFMLASFVSSELFSVEVQ